MSILRSALLGFIVLTASFNSHAITPLFDGGFESGTLQGWNPTAGAVVATRGTCFSGGDTTQIRMRGQYAGLLRSSKGTLSSFTSKSFVAGTGVTFLSLSELIGKRSKFNPYAINVSILDGAANVLRTQPLATALIKLKKGCPSSKRDHSFSPHFLSTRDFQGQQIKIRFTHHKDIAKTGAFTLIDEVGVVDSSVPIYLSYPNARAGMTLNDGILSLTSGLPSNLQQTESWQYSWFIDGETTERPYFNPCIDDLSIGEYTANLYIYDPSNNRLVTDTFNFVVPKLPEITVTSNTDDTNVTTETTAVVTDSSTASTTVSDTDISINSNTCNAVHPLNLVSVVKPAYFNHV